MAKRNSSDNKGRKNSDRRGRSGSASGNSTRKSPGGTSSQGPRSGGKSFERKKDSDSERSSPGRKSFSRGDQKGFPKSGSPRSGPPRKDFGGDKREGGDRKRSGYSRDKNDSSKRSFSGKEERPYRRSSSDQGEKPFRKSSSERGEKPFRKSSSDGDKPFRRSSSDSDKKPFRKSSSDQGARPFRKSSSEGERPFRRSSSDSDKKPFRKSSSDRGEKPFRKSSSEGEKPFRRSKSSNEGDRGSDRTSANKKTGGRFPVDDRKDSSRPGKKNFTSSDSGKDREGNPDQRERRPFKKVQPPQEQISVAPPVQTEQMRLNRYIANSGVCSRREADELITMGLISVNGKTITEMGFKVNPGDVVRYEDRVLKAERLVYILLNKPKGFLTTTSDPQERNTVMHLIANSVKERVYPVGRLDRNTTGLLLLTNDGDLADKLMHPSYNVKKIYKVELDRALTKVDFQKLQEGIELEEGKAVVDDIAIVSDDGKTVGIELHIGWNRVVRRLFESLDYEVVKLDRSVYAGLDKKDLPRGHWRFLRKEELIHLKHYK